MTKLSRNFGKASTNHDCKIGSYVNFIVVIFYSFTKWFCSKSWGLFSKFFRAAKYVSHY